MIIYQEELAELMRWARCYDLLRAFPPVRLEISAEISYVSVANHFDTREPMYPTVIVARAYLREPRCDHAVGYCECKSIREQLLKINPLLTLEPGV